MLNSDITNLSRPQAVHYSLNFTIFYYNNNGIDIKQYIKT